MYQGIPLSQFRVPTSTSESAVKSTGTAATCSVTMITTGVTLTQTVPNQTAVTASTSSAENDLLGKTNTKSAKTLLQHLLTCCNVNLISDQELVPSKDWIPENFWSAEGFRDCVLPRELVEGVDSWWKTEKWLTLALLHLLPVVIPVSVCCKFYVFKYRNRWKIFLNF